MAGSCIMQDATLNELLPFGEYIAPERAAAASVPHFMAGLDAWELEHLLHRLVRCICPPTSGGISPRLTRVTLLHPSAA